MFAVDVCALPATGFDVGFGMVVAALFFLLAGGMVVRWVRASAGRLSVVAVVPVLLMGFVAASSAGIPCEQVLVSPSTTDAPIVVPSTTTTVPFTTTTVPSTTTTVVPVDPDMVLQIDTSLQIIPLASEGSVTQSDSVPNPTFDFELGLFGDVDVKVDWGDGSTSVVVEPGPVLHTYSTSGRYEIRVSGKLTGFGQDETQGTRPLAGVEYLLGVSSFGNLGLEYLDYGFYYASNLVSLPAVLPSSVVSLYELFWSATSFNDASIGAWDTSHVTNMFYLFDNAISFNQDIGGWDTSQVTNMSYMFSLASSFNADISDWDTSKVTDMAGMFYYASSFNADIKDWDTSKVTNMSYMFNSAESFDQNLDLLDIALVTDMTGMFDGSALSDTNYDSTLIGWASQSVKSAVNLGALGLSVASDAGFNARATLTEDHDWRILDGAG